VSSKAAGPTRDGERIVLLLRAVNVGGITLRMADLKAVCTALGFADVRTVLQSGNVVCEVPNGRERRAPAAIENEVEEALRTRLSLTSDVLVRRAAEWDAIVAANPFPEHAASDPAHLVVMVLKQAPAPSAVKALQQWIKGPEQVRARDRELYIVYPGGIGPSKLSGSVIERMLQTRGTARNWNTVSKLAMLAGGALS
jgi:uncharacterized protein (DUF1697 family)